MKPCPHCGGDNADGDKFCKRCGRPLAEAAPSDATVQWTGQAPPAASLRRSYPVEALFASKTTLLIGRAPECDVYLPHPTVSRHHARLERLAQGLQLTDLGSVNGVHAGGRRLTEPILVQEHQRVGIGPFLFSLSGGAIHVLDNSQRLGWRRATWRRSSSRRRASRGNCSTTSTWPSSPASSSACWGRAARARAR
jgi:hypothetical protein